MFKDNGEYKEEDIKQNACQSYEESPQNPFFAWFERDTDSS